MHSILLIRENIKRIYATYNIYIDFLFKFAVSLTAFILLNYNYKTTEYMSNIFIVLGLSVICGLFPTTVSVYTVLFFATYKIYFISYEMLIIFLSYFVIIWIFYFTFNIKQSYLLILIPILFVFKLYYVAPVILALIYTPIIIVPMSGSIIMYYIVLYIKSNAALFVNTGNLDNLRRFVNSINGLIVNKNMIVLLISSIVCYLCIYFISKSSINYSHYIALVVGLWSVFFISFLAKFYFSIDVDIISLVISCIATAIISCIYFLGIYNIDYSRTEYLRYEDDEYMYYVKAVPKLSVSTTDKKVTKISGRTNKKKKNNIMESE